MMAAMLNSQEEKRERKRKVMDDFVVGGTRGTTKVDVHQRPTDPPAKKSKVSPTAKQEQQRPGTSKQEQQRPGTSKEVQQNPGSSKKVQHGSSTGEDTGCKSKKCFRQPELLDSDWFSRALDLQRDKDRDKVSRQLDFKVPSVPSQRRPNTTPAATQRTSKAPPKEQTPAAATDGVDGGVQGISDDEGQQAPPREDTFGTPHGNNTPFAESDSAASVMSQRSMSGLSQKLGKMAYKSVVAFPSILIFRRSARPDGEDHPKAFSSLQDPNHGGADFQTGSKAIGGIGRCSGRNAPAQGQH
jgi:hypothetical protein